MIWKSIKMINRKYNKWFLLKRFMDIILSILSLPVFFIALIIVAIVQYRTIGVFFVQPRIGLQGSTFNIYKFKTMTTASNKMVLNRKGIVKRKDDIRITKFGKFLRSSSIDEIPQIFNIFKGKMSWVGPRPIVKIEFDNLTEIEKSRSNVIPGITGLAQINGRDALDINTLIKYDLEYIENYSFQLDLDILLKSVKVVLAKKNNY